MATTWYEELQFAVHLAALVRDPSRTERIGKLAELANQLRDQRPVEAFVAHAMRDAGYRDLYFARYEPPIPSVATLASYPVGSLGRVYAEHMGRGGLSQAFLRVRGGNDPIRYLTERQVRVHDMLHVATGYDTSITDELALQAFMLAQLPGVVAAALIAGGVLRQLRTDHAGVQELFAEVADGFHRGQQAAFVLGFPWESSLRAPLREVRDELGILPREAGMEGLRVRHPAGNEVVKDPRLHGVASWPPPASRVAS